MSYVHEKAEYVDWVLTFIAIGFYLFQSSFCTVFFFFFLIKLVSTDFVVLGSFLLQDSWGLAGVRFLHAYSEIVPLIQLNSSS